SINARNSDLPTTWRMRGHCQSLRLPPAARFFLTVNLKMTVVINEKNHKRPYLRKRPGVQREELPDGCTDGRRVSEGAEGKERNLARLRKGHGYCRSPGLCRSGARSRRSF